MRSKTMNRTDGKKDEYVSVLVSIWHCIVTKIYNTICWRL